MTGVFEIMHYPIAEIVLGEAYRSVSQEHVQSLSKSIDECGLIHPVTLDGRGRLLAGRHRVEACRLLEWQTIPARIMELETVDAELVTIDENLLHNELTAWERKVQMVRRQELYEMKYPQARNNEAQAAGKKRSVSPTDLSAMFALRSVGEPTGNQKSRILLALQEAGTYGKTGQELEDAVGLPGNTLWPRLGELLRDGHVRKTEAKRVTRSGKYATIYVLAEKSPEVPDAVQSFVTHTSKATKRSKRSIETDLAVAKAIDPGVAAQIPGSSIEDREMDLQTLSQMEPQQQRDVMAKIAAGDAKTVKAAVGQNGKQSSPRDRTKVALPANPREAVRVLRRYFTADEMRELALWILGEDDVQRVVYAVQRRYGRGPVEQALRSNSGRRSAPPHPERAAIKEEDYATV